MDPNTTWKEILSCIQCFTNPESDRIEHFAVELRAWLAKGGYPPTITGNDVVDGYIVRAVIDRILG